jgi:hypothetical protein
VLPIAAIATWCVLTCPQVYRGMLARLARSAKPLAARNTSSVICLLLASPA